MFDTREQIRSQLRAGEDGRAEFKEVRFGDRGVLSPDTEELAGELVAFANAEGGVTRVTFRDEDGVDRYAIGVSWRHGNDAWVGDPPSAETSRAHAVRAVKASRDVPLRHHAV